MKCAIHMGKAREIDCRGNTDVQETSQFMTSMNSEIGQSESRILEPCTFRKYRSSGWNLYVVHWLLNDFIEDYIWDEPQTCAQSSYFAPFKMQIRVQARRAIHSLLAVKVTLVVFIRWKCKSRAEIWTSVIWQTDPLWTRRTPVSAYFIRWNARGRESWMSRPVCLQAQAFMPKHNGGL